MPTLFFSYDQPYHDARVALKKRPDPRDLKRTFELEAERDRFDQSKVFAERELRAVCSAAELGEKQKKKYLAADKEWRKRHRVAIQLREKYEEEFVKKSIVQLQERDERLDRRNLRRQSLLGTYGNRAFLSQTNLGTAKYKPMG
ncbi:unnamed protein product [Amoebophrya sp. A120]|nr:unnamed protein product [Amoebophrya sp. A120]|eukprot:GSA120T00007111001.1